MDVKQTGVGLMKWASLIPMSFLYHCAWGQFHILNHLPVHIGAYLFIHLFWSPGIQCGNFWVLGQYSTTQLFPSSFFTFFLANGHNNLLRLALNLCCCCLMLWVGEIVCLHQQSQLYIISSERGRNWTHFWLECVIILHIGAS